MTLTALLRYFPRLLIVKDLSIFLWAKHNKIIRETFKDKNDIKQPLLELNKRSQKICCITEHESDFMLASMSTSVDVKLRHEVAKKSPLAEKAS